jgi:hypothetical protein
MLADFVRENAAHFVWKNPGMVIAGWGRCRVLRGRHSIIGKNRVSAEQKEAVPSFLPDVRSNAFFAKMSRSVFAGKWENI